MKRLAEIIIILTFLLLFTEMSLSASPKFTLTHKLVGSSMGDKTVTLNFTMHLKNHGNDSISNLILSFIPMPPFMPVGTTLKIDSLAPHQNTDLPLQLTIPASVYAAELYSHRQLFFVGKSFDSQGKPTEFPVTSHFHLPGGVK